MFPKSGAFHLSEPPTSEIFPIYDPANCLLISGGLEHSMGSENNPVKSQYHGCLSANTDKDGSVTSTIKYNNLNEGKAINTKINAGVIVQINSNVPWLRYSSLIEDL